MIDAHTHAVIRSKQHGIMHTLRRVHRASRVAGETECERQMQRLRDKCDAYCAWLGEHGLDHNEIDGAYQNFTWHAVISHLIISPGGAREQWVVEALRIQRRIKDERSRLETLHELALLHPSWLNEREQAAVDEYLADLHPVRRTEILAQRDSDHPAD